MRRFETEPRALKPPDFDAFVEELGLLADCEGAWALVGAFWHAPTEACRYLASHPIIWEYLLARAHYADSKRWDLGVRLGRGVGL